MYVRTKMNNNNYNTTKRENIKEKSNIKVNKFS